MEQIKNTSELLSWFNPHKENLRTIYINRLKSSLNLSDHIKASIAYHVINEKALEEDYDLTDCQINKLALLIVMQE